VLKKEEPRLRYGQIVELYYGIALPPGALAAVDCHFLTAAHHWHRSLRSRCKTAREFHTSRCGKHLRALMLIVKQGDFSAAEDATRRGLAGPEGWDPGRRQMPDERMFAGVAHPNDSMLGLAS
jgi:hypothetical protein